MRLTLIAILIVLALLPVAIVQYVFAQGSLQNVEIRVDENGVATVAIVTSISAGVTTIELPVDPIAVTIDVNSSVSGVEWVLEDGHLYIASPSRSTVRLTYIANVSIENSVITLNVRTNSSVRLVLAPTILLLTLPENVTSITTLPGGELEIIFTGPATISYTIAPLTTPITAPITATTPSATTSPSPTTALSTPITTTFTPTTRPTTPSSTTTSMVTTPTTPPASTPITQTSSPSTTATQTQSISLSTIAVIVIIVVIAIIIALIIRRR